MIGRFLATMDRFAINIYKYAAFHYAMITTFMYFIVSNSYQIEQRMLNTTIKSISICVAFAVQGAFFSFLAKNHFNRLKEIKHAKRLKRLDILSDSSSILKDEEDKARTLLAKYKRIA